jgi:hypothetical protein
MSELLKNEVVAFDDESISGRLTGKKTQPYTSLPLVTAEDKVKLFNVTSNPSKRLRDMVGKTITFRHVYAEEIEIKNDQTGELQMAPRIIIVDDKGESYVSVSKGVFSAVKRLFDIFGTPDQWEKSIKIEIRQIAKDKNVTLTFEVVQ